MRKKKREPETFSFHQDRALKLCREKYGPCPLGRGKDGAPNCHYSVVRLECEPARLTVDGEP